MNRIYTAFTAAALFVSTPATSYGQSSSDMRDDQLLGAIVQATEESEAADLLGFMQEASRRGLLMFEGERICESGVPETGLMDNQFKRGRVNWAYHMRVWEMAMEDGFCGCVYELQSFPQFQRELVGHDGEITESDVDVFNAFWRERKQVIEPAYRAFKDERCGD